MNLIDQKIAKAISEMKEWVNNPIRGQDNYQQNVNEIEDYAKESVIRKSIVNRFDYLNTWLSTNFVYDELVNQKQSPFRIQAATNGYYTIIISGILADQYPSNPPKLLFDRVAYWLANCVILNWYDEATKLIQVINKGLSNKFLNGGLNFKQSSWFIVEITNKVLGEEGLNYQQFNYPLEMGIYEDVLSNWDTKDINLVDQLVEELCEFHLKNATYGDGENVADIQFGNDYWFVYAFEILSWLSLRKRAGLENPEKFSHPLMNLHLNSEIESFTPMPADDLAQRVLQKIG